MAPQRAPVRNDYTHPESPKCPAVLSYGAVWKLNASDPSLAQLKK